MTLHSLIFILSHSIINLNYYLIIQFIFYCFPFLHLIRLNRVKFICLTILYFLIFISPYLLTHLN